MRSTREEIVIDSASTEANYWADLWRYRELFYFLAWRDLLIRYKQTVIGVAWVALRPLLIMLVFSLVFGKLLNLQSSGAAPYAIVVFAALLPWQFFSTAFSEAGNSLIGNAAMLSKIYFPRLIIPISVVVAALVDFLVSCAILFGLMLWYGFEPTLRLLSLPFFTGVALIAALGAGLWIAALNVKYRDFRFVIPFVVQFGLYISPVGFSTEIIPKQWLLLYSLNPMVGVIDGFRWAILGGDYSLYVPGFALSLCIILLVFLGGIAYFRRVENTFADVI